MAQKRQYRIVHDKAPTVIDGEVLKRKNTWHPCALGPRLDEVEGTAEYVRLMNAAYWADNITNAEWPVVLDQKGATAPNRSRLKRKGAGWLMALARIAYLNPGLYRAMAESARTMYADQVGEKYPWAKLVPALGGLTNAEPGESTVVVIEKTYADEEGLEEFTLLVDPETERLYVRIGEDLRRVSLSFVAEDDEAD